MYSVVKTVKTFAAGNASSFEVSDIVNKSIYISVGWITEIFEGTRASMKKKTFWLYDKKNLQG
jgi:hypothetical protein